MHDTQPFTLRLHPACAPGPAGGIRGGILRGPSQLHLTWLLTGDLGQVRIPAPATPRAADELWRHTCFELFVAIPGEAGYLEFNFSPSGEWAIYRFSGYRERVPFDASALAPRITVSRGASGALALDATVACGALPALCTGPLRAALSAVVEAGDGTLSYWALKHPSAKPDFHHPDAFVLELDEIRH